ncbi:MAG: hypothetical protein EOM24_27140 [Chloroflexia bacterium]|nr:hypothetical protein [Chloroflexia bacterium]
MAWQSYEVVFRLRTPAHLGWGEVGNLLRTRPYVTGRVVWGALTMRLTRDATEAHTSAPNAQAYQRIGKQVHQSLASTYLYPATIRDGAYQIVWPWENPTQFRYRFLRSYGSTALTYPQQSAASGMLHEVEFIAPKTTDTGEAVFLVGYIFEADECNLNWQAACHRLQVGGERSYGWGDLALIQCQRVVDQTLFHNHACNNHVRFDGSHERPVLEIDAGQALLAHTRAHHMRASGDIEPLIGREWRRHPGQHVAYDGICFVPGSTVTLEPNSTTTVSVEIGYFGVWEGLATPTASEAVR